MKRLENITYLTREDVESFNKELFSLIQSDDDYLNRILNYVFSNTGKQVRAHMVFLSARLFGEVNHKARITAILVQLLHTSTLIHDDVVDEALIRRGQKTVNTLWRNKIAILTGDYLFSKALDIAVEKKLFDILEILAPTIAQMSMGEIIQLKEKEKAQYSEEVYNNIIHRKTAVLISASAQAGAKSAGASKDEQLAMRNFGHEAGMAFQIQDDILDFKADGKFGKTNGKDLEEKKYTLPLIHALDKAPQYKSSGIIKIIEKGVSKKDKQEILHFIEDYGGFQYARKIMHNHIKSAKSVLKTLPDNEANVALSDLIVYFTERNK
ncbi:MAG: polyprenyl synthetase family protein [Bacteroidota bacterium]